MANERVHGRAGHGRPQSVTARWAQELWSLGLVYNPVRLEMEQIAAEAGVTPRRISFIAALQFVQNFWLVGAAMAPTRIPRRLRELNLGVLGD